MKRILLIINLLLIISLFSGCTKFTNNQINVSGQYFDTAVSITIYGGTKDVADKCKDICSKYENMFSNKIDSSEISMININSAKGNWTSVSNETLELIKKGIEFGNISNGLFDITIGEVSQLWDFKDGNNLPDPATIKEKISNVNYKNIEIDGNNVRLSNPNAKLDLGGIAKGYIADKLKEYLLSQNIDSALINLGGNVLLVGSKLDGSNFRIGIQKPFEESGETILVVNTHDKSIVTSGTYERYFYKDNKLYHHILDTHTGYPVENDLCSVTIISDSSMMGDGLSTTAFLMGLNDGLNYIESLENTEAIFIDKDLKIHTTSGLNINNNEVTIK